jgi:hypothetical protein
MFKTPTLLAPPLGRHQLNLLCAVSCVAKKSLYLGAELSGIFCLALALLGNFCASSAKNFGKHQNQPPSTIKQQTTWNHGGRGLKNHRYHPPLASTITRRSINLNAATMSTIRHQLPSPVPLRAQYHCGMPGLYLVGWLRSR